MDFAPSPQQRLLVQTARGLLQQRCPPERVQGLALEPRGFADDLWKEMATLGWPGLLIPPALGGIGGSILDVVALVEEMGRALAPSPYVQSAVVATSMLLASDSHRARQLLAALALGERIAAVAVAEAAASFEHETITLRVEGSGPLSGCKLFVKDAHVATDLVVAARGAAGLAITTLPVDRAGIRVLTMESMGDEKIFEVTFDDVEVRGEDLLAGPGRADDLLASAMQLGAVCRSAEMVGCAQRVLELCVEHARVRVQSGRAIGAFQAIQHQCADLLRDVEASRWLVYDAAWRIAEGLDGSAAVATAKAFCGDACLRAARRGHIRSWAPSAIARSTRCTSTTNAFSRPDSTGETRRPTSRPCPVDRAPLRIDARRVSTKRGADAMMTAAEFVRMELRRLHKNLDACINDITPEQLHALPGNHPGANTIAFVLWHCTRTEDNVVRFVVQDRRPTVWQEGGYPEKLGLPLAAQGTGMPTAEAQALRLKDIGLFKEYMQKVWASTEELFEKAQGEPAVLDKTVLVKPIGEMPAIRAVGQICLSHGMAHFGEMELARALLGLKPVVGM